MKTYSQFLSEALITFNGQAYPKFGQVIILAGGAGSGKGFILKNLIGVEGKVFDVDALKTLVLASDKIKSLVKNTYGYNMDSFRLNNPEHVSMLHDIVDTKLGLVKGKERAFFKSAISAVPERKPNVIFDVTLKDLAKLDKILNMTLAMGYLPENVHLVWVANKFEIAMQQNQSRQRVVPENIFVSTHEGASKSIKDLMSLGQVTGKMGDFFIAFNQKDVDIQANVSNTGKVSIAKKGANYIKIKSSKSSKIELDQKSIDKIKSYVPNPEVWN